MDGVLVKLTSGGSIIDADCFNARNMAGELMIPPRR